MRLRDAWLRWRGVKAPRPSGDTTGTTDAHNLQQTIDRAPTGSTVILRPGTYILGGGGVELDRDVQIKGTIKTQWRGSDGSYAVGYLGNPS